MIIKKRSKIGFTCGAFDLLHAGHILMLEEAKKQCDFLIVGLQKDPSIDRAYKNKPVQTLKERRIQLEGCKYVDKVIVYSTEKSLVRLLKRINPDIRILGEDWKHKEFTGKNLKIPCYFNSRKHKYSSSDLRKRVLESELSKSFLGLDYMADSVSIGKVPK